MSVTIHVELHTDAVAGALLKGADRVAQTSAYRVEAGWKQRAPVKTGAYRRDIRTQKQNDADYVVLSSLEYPIYLEYGTRFMAPRPSMNPAVEEERPRFETALRALFGEAA